MAARPEKSATEKELRSAETRFDVLFYNMDLNPFKAVARSLHTFTGWKLAALIVAGAERSLSAASWGCIRYFPTQAFNLAFKDSVGRMFPKYNPKTIFCLRPSAGLGNQP